MKPTIFDEKIDHLATLVEEGARATKNATSRFIEPAQGTLRRAESRRHHIIFGRRGSGKSSLLYKSADNLTSNNSPVAYIDLEPFKGHHYPDILISVLLASLSKFRLWFEYWDSNQKKSRPWYTLFLWEKRNQIEKKKDKLIQDLKVNIDELLKQLHLSDDASLIEKYFRSLNKKKEAAVKSSMNQQSILMDFNLESDIAASTQSSKSTETHEEYKRSKIDYLHRKIIDFQDIFRRFNNITNCDCFLFLDDLYHIHRPDQPFLLDYFHRIAKGNNLWMKIGTIKNRSRWYVHEPQPIGLKLGDDADDINLDLTLEKFSSSKEFLKSVLKAYINEAKGPKLSDFIAPGGIDRLVISSGGVTRDFLGIFRRSIDETRDRLNANIDHPRGHKIGAEDVNMAAGSYGDTKKEEFNRDTLDDRDELEENFNNIKGFCLEKTKTNIFLLDQDLKGPALDLTQELIDLRLIHHVRSRVTVSTRPGKIYRALLLDVSQYTGARKRRDVEMIDFWKESKKEIVRRASLIYDPLDIKSNINKDVAGISKYKSDDVKNKQRKLFDTFE